MILIIRVTKLIAIPIRPIDQTINITLSMLGILENVEIRFDIEDFLLINNITQI